MMSKELKRMLHLCVLVAIRRFPEFKHFYKRKNAEVKHSMSVPGAIRNKIALRMAAVFPKLNRAGLKTFVFIIAISSTRVVVEKHFFPSLYNSCTLKFFEMIVPALYSANSIERDKWRRVFQYAITCLIRYGVKSNQDNLWKSFSRF
jgi:hypothetical protein